MKVMKAPKRPAGLYDEVEHPSHGKGVCTGFNVKDQTSIVQFENHTRAFGVPWKEVQVTKKWGDEGG